MNTIDVTYKCKCLDAEVTVAVPERLPDEDIMDWINGVLGPTLHVDHRQRSPKCRAETMEHLKLPFAAGELGAKARVH